MKYHYASGEPICLGDEVRIGTMGSGRVIGIIDTGEFLGEHKKEHWVDFRGILVESPEYGLLNYQDQKRMLELAKR